ncbi:5'-fluoro-5'-deoxy-adenosine synthase [bacterium HR23]|nr:5'-fluoro-5'-deoxy-adenosine synthase [bacterium HR23]
MPPLITFLTDYGTREPYAGEVKGVIRAICPQAEVIDLTHQVPPGDVHAGAFLLGMVWRSFPPGTVHLAVVDPGVGTARLPIVLATPEALFVGPDNGLFTYVLRPFLPPMGKDVHPFLAPVRLPLPSGISAYALTEARWFRHPVSRTFHGRDIFGPCAGWLANGKPPHEFGPPVADLVCLWVPEPVWEQGVLEGVVLHIDRFGNLLTSVHAGHLEGVDPQAVLVEVGGLCWQGLAGAYAEGEWTAHVESHGWLEIARRGASAGEALGVKVGSPVRLRLTGR